MLGNELLDVLASRDGDAAVSLVAVETEAEHGAPWTWSGREGEAVLGDLAKEVVEDSLRGGAANAVVDVVRKDDAAELVVEAIDVIVVDADSKAYGEESVAQLLCKETRGLNCAVDGLVQLPDHTLAVGTAFFFTLGELRLVAVDVGVDVSGEECTMQVEVEVDPAGDHGGDDDELD